MRASVTSGFLDLGALVEVGVKDVQLGLFEVAGRRIDHRYVMSLAYLARHLSLDPLPGLANKR
jgi:hypothetical protein